MCSLSQHWTCFQKSLLELPEEAFPAGLTPFHTRFMWLLDWIPVARFVDGPGWGPGRPPHDRRALLRAFLAKALGNIPTTESLIERLHADPTLRRLCGWERRSQIPPSCTFSRAFAEFARAAVLDTIHAWLVKQHLADTLVWHVSRDSTAIAARERCQKEPQETPETQKPPETQETQETQKPQKPQKRGGARKTGRAPKRKSARGKTSSGKPEPSRLQRQFAAGLAETDALLAELPSRCDIGTKRNARGDLERWRGYKLHADTGDDGIPLFCFTTSASMHDSQAAIPMARKTATRVDSLYDLMDAAYDAEAIWHTSYQLGHVPIIDENPGRKGQAAKLPREPDRARRYRHRSGAERFNSLLKDGHGGRHVRVRGRTKVHAHLMTGVVVIFAGVLQGWAAG